MERNFETEALVREVLRWESTLGTAGIPSPDRPTRSAPPPAKRVASPPMDEGAPPVARKSLDVLQSEAESCQACALHKGRTLSVFARGNPAAKVLFIGEGPGYHEDQQGVPFVGKAGQLLDKMIAAMGLTEGEVYICNVVKCRPPQNRTPLPEEALACRPFLLGQIHNVLPEMIVALGRCASEHLGCVPERGGWRGKWGSFSDVRVMPTYHPAFLLRTPNMKRPVWEDLKAVMAALGREVSS